MRLSDDNSLLWSCFSFRVIKWPCVMNYSASTHILFDRRDRISRWVGEWIEFEIRFDVSPICRKKGSRRCFFILEVHNSSSLQVPPIPQKSIKKVPTWSSTFTRIRGPCGYSSFAGCQVLSSWLAGCQVLSSWLWQVLRYAIFFSAPTCLSQE